MENIAGLIQEIDHLLANPSQYALKVRAFVALV